MAGLIIVIIKIILIKLSTSLMREEVEPSECPVIENQRVGAGFQGWSNIIIIIIRSTITVTIIITIYMIVVVVNIIFTRPKPAYGRQGLAGLWDQDTDEVSNFWVFLTSHFAQLGIKPTWDHS